MVFLTVKKTFRFFSPLKKPKKTWFLFLRKKTLRFFNIWSEHLLLKWSHLSERLNYVSFHTSLMQLSLDINFPASFFKRFDRLHFQSHSSGVDVEEKFFLHICGKKRLDCNLRLERENQQTARRVFIQYCAEKTKSTKLEGKFWIRNCDQKQKSIAGEVKTVSTSLAEKLI